MHYANGNKSINLANVMPSETYDATSFFEFTIDGKNTTTNKDIWYEINLVHGDNHATRTTRIQDKFLKFRLTEVSGTTETEIFTDKSYSDLTNKRIYTNKISKNSTSFSKKYRLYMWISKSVVIGNDRADYDIDTWNNQVYASIKVNVVGDFNKKELANCYTTQTIKLYNVIDELDSTQISNCTNFVSTETGWSWYVGETPEAFCKGTGTNHGETLQGILDSGQINDYTDALEFLVNNNIIIEKGQGIALSNYYETCGTSVTIPNTIDDIPVTLIEKETFASKNITNVTLPDSLRAIGENSFNGNQLSVVETPSTVTSIGDGAFASNQIETVYLADGLLTIGAGAFNSNRITEIDLPSSLLLINVSAFAANNISNVVIPENVRIVRNEAFLSNPISQIMFVEPSKLERIDSEAFKTSNGSYTDVIVPDTVTYLSCSAFNDDVTITKADSLVCSN